ncbi:hypothetical protein [Sporisorium scitamineum]|uniref:TAF9-TFIID and SAGA subunit n=1 Tax=Sporisorium scitamineum TaxID=49012 RepID=A0A0F7S6Z0_9BASI|nr:hypothetical protein [Sporisorium scitamineum]
MVAYQGPAASSSSHNDTGLRGPVPRDARLIALILASMGVSDVEPAVLLQLLEFAHRYTYDVLSDALAYSDHANSRQAGSNLSLEDVTLAIQSRVNCSFTKPPDKIVLLELANMVNSVLFPLISDRHGVRLPPQQHCLTNVNFGIVPNPPPEDFDDFEAPQPQHPPPPTTTANAAAAASQSTQPDTQASTLFDTTQTRPGSQPTGESQVEAKDGGQDAARGVKRNLDEDEEYD